MSKTGIDVTTLDPAVASPAAAGTDVATVDAVGESTVTASTAAARTMAASTVTASTAAASTVTASTVTASTVTASDPADEEAGVRAAELDAVKGPSLSPSRAGDFMTCPLLYRFRVIDRLPEPPSPAAARGTLVHAVLERLFDEPAGNRTPDAAKGLLAPQWERLVAEEPALADLFPDEAELVTWRDAAGEMLDRYFTLEDPRRIEPTYREMSVRAALESGLTLRGYIDRLDVAPTGEIRIVDYKTGTAPREEYEARALFQMKFYALALWRGQGTVPRLLQLIYLGNGEIVRYAPDEADLLATERKVNALWQAIDRARSSGDWRPHQSRLCEWCAYQAFCPAFGGTPPPLPADDMASTDDIASTDDMVPAEDVQPASQLLPADHAALAHSATAVVPAQPGESDRRS